MFEIVEAKQECYNSFKVSLNTPLVIIEYRSVISGCIYPCYAFMMKKRFRQVNSYEGWLNPYLVSNTLELLDKEVPKLHDKIESVHLCFTTDPFMYEYDEIAEMSIAAIKKLNNAG